MSISSEEKKSENAGKRQGACNTIDFHSLKKKGVHGTQYREYGSRKKAKEERRPATWSYREAAQTINATQDASQME